MTAISSANEILVWVTSLSDSENVVGAEVRLYKIQNKVILENKGTTGIDGTASLKITSSNNGRLVVVIIKNGQISILEGVNSFHQKPSIINQAELLTERKLYRIGERIYCKGFARKYHIHQRKYLIPQGKAELTIRWNVQAQETVRVDIDPIYGSFNCTFDIPSSMLLESLLSKIFSDADYGFHTIELTIKQNMIQATDFLIADPRIPSGLLEFSFPNMTIYKLQDNRGAEFEVVTKSYTGTPIESEAIIRWKVQRNQRETPHYNPYIGYEEHNRRIYHSSPQEFVGVSSKFYLLFHGMIKNNRPHCHKK